MEIFGWNQKTCSSLDEALKSPRTTRRLRIHGPGWDVPGPDFKEFSAAFPALTQLRHFEIGWCDWTRLPSTIASLKQLRSLVVLNSVVQQFPDFLNQCPKLNRLILRGTDIKDGNLSSVVLSKLSYLDLGNNRLTEIPVEIGNFKNLRRLFLGDNLLIAISHSITTLRKLREFGLVGNPYLPKKEIERISIMMPKVRIYCNYGNLKGGAWAPPDLRRPPQFPKFLLSGHWHKVVSSRRAPPREQKNEPPF